VSNFATVTDACSVAAIGVDFGIRNLPLPSGGVTSATPNTASGNALSGNTGVPGAGADTGESVSISTSVSALNSVISTVVGNLTGAGLGSLPGVYVVCTVAPMSITLVSGSNTLNLATSTSLYSGTFSSKMSGTGGGASGSNQISYTLALTGTPVSTGVAGLPLLAVFSAAFVATGTIPGTQTGNTIVSGTYSDTATATVNF
jgi:hypothetical protein